MDAAGRGHGSLPADNGSLIAALRSAARKLIDACELADDGGCCHVYLANVVGVFDELVGESVTLRNELAREIGWPARTDCSAVICSGRWNAQETAGSEAGGKEPQRKRR